MYMALDSDIVEIIETVIKNDLTAPRVPKKRVPKLKHVWKCQSAHFFTDTG
jgi:hypothetical protein